MTMFTTFAKFFQEYTSHNDFDNWLSFPSHTSTEFSKSRGLLYALINSIYVLSIDRAKCNLFYFVQLRLRKNKYKFS